MCKGLQFPGAPKEEGVSTLKLWAERAPIVYPWAPGRELWLPPKTHMSIHSLVARQAGLVGVLGEVCRVRVYQHSLGPKVLGNGYLKEKRKERFFVFKGSFSFAAVILKGPLCVVAITCHL